MVKAFKKLFILENHQYDLDICRILFFMIIFVFFFRSPILYYSPELPLIYDPSFLHKWLHLPAPGPWLDGLQKLFFGSLITSAIGFLTPISMTLSFLLGFYICGLYWSLGGTEHLNNIIIISMGIVMLSGTGIFFSLDSLIGRYFPRYPLITKKTSENDTWAIRMIQLSICLMYFNAGISKIRGVGLNFISTENFQNMLFLRTSFASPEFEKIRFYFFNHLQYGSALLTIAFATELASPLAFFMTGWPRWMILASLVSIHIGSHILLGVDFSIFIAVYIFWIPWTSILRRAGIPKIA